MHLGASYTFEVDMWSLGVIAYIMYDFILFVKIEQKLLKRSIHFQSFPL